jgi:hypothetical protein
VKIFTLKPFVEKHADSFLNWVSRELEKATMEGGEQEGLGRSAAEGPTGADIKSEISEEYLKVHQTAPTAEETSNKWSDGSASRQQPKSPMSSQFLCSRLMSEVATAADTAGPEAWTTVTKAHPASSAAEYVISQPQRPLVSPVCAILEETSSHHEAN